MKKTVCLNSIIDFVSNGALRDYSRGVALFKKTATKELLARYGNFLENAEPEMALPMLKAKLAALLITIRTEPERFQQVDFETPEEKINDDRDLKDIKQETERNGDVCQDLETRVEEAEKGIDKLENRIGELEKPGIRLTEVNALPPDLQIAYGQIKMMVPKMAHLHAELFNAPNDERRKSVATQLCRMDSERRDLWKKIDQWYLKPEAAEKSPFKQAEALRRRRKRCMQNILSTTKALERYEKDTDKKMTCRLAAERLERYNEELKIINEMLGIN